MPITSHLRDFQVTTERFGDEAAIAGAIGAAGAIGGELWSNMLGIRSQISIAQKWSLDVSKVTNSWFQQGFFRSHSSRAFFSRWLVDRAAGSDGSQIADDAGGGSSNLKLSEKWGYNLFRFGMELGVITINKHNCYGKSWGKNNHHHAGLP